MTPTVERSLVLLSVLCTLVTHEAQGQTGAAFLVLGSDSAVYQRDDSGESLYAFPSGTRLRLDFAAKASDRLAFTIPVDGFENGLLEAPGKNSLRLRLAQPAAGSIRLSSGGELSVELEASIAVSDAVTGTSLTHRVRLTTEKPASPIPGEATLDGRKLDPRSGELQLVAAGTVRAADGKIVGTYHSLVSGYIENLPESARALLAD